MYCAQSLPPIARLIVEKLRPWLSRLSRAFYHRSLSCHPQLLRISSNTRISSSFQDESCNSPLLWVASHSGWLIPLATSPSQLPLLIACHCFEGLRPFLGSPILGKLSLSSPLLASALLSLYPPSTKLSGTILNRQSQIQICLINRCNTSLRLFSMLLRLLQFLSP